MMLDQDIVAVSPSSVWRVLGQAGLLAKWNGKASKKGTGFEQPPYPHQHWHIDVSYINIRGTFYYLCSVLDGYSRAIVHWDLRESMTEAEIEIILEGAKEKRSRQRESRAKMIEPGKTEAGSAGMHPCRGIAWWAHRDDVHERGSSPCAPVPKRIGSVDPDALKIPARRAEYSLTGNPPSPFHAEPAQLGRTRLERVYGMFRGTAVQTESLECLAEIEFALPTSFFTKNQECFIMSVTAHFVQAHPRRSSRKRSLLSISPRSMGPSRTTRRTRSTSMFESALRISQTNPELLGRLEAARQDLSSIAAVTVRFLADEDLHCGLTEGLRSREPAAAFLDVKSTGLSGTAERAAQHRGQCTTLAIMRLALVFLLSATWPVLAQDPSKPNDFRGWMDKGGLDFSNARYPEAVVDFQQATGLAPDDLGARLALARAYLAQYVPASLAPGNAALAEKARAEFGRVLETDPRNMTALRSLGTLSLQEAQALPEANRQPKLEDARDWYHRVIELDARSKEAFYSLGLIDWLRFSPAWLSARTKLGLKLDSAGPLADAAVRQELTAKYGRAIDAAATNLSEALEIDPDYADALATMSWVARLRADLSDTDSQYRADIAQSLQWAEKAKQAQKLKNPERLRVAADAQAAKLISKTDPVYPPAAEQQKIQGTVQLHAVIDKNGRVTSTQFVSGPEMLADAAQETVRKWVYRPTFFNGQPVEVITYIDVKFTLR